MKEIRFVDLRTTMHVMPLPAIEKTIGKERRKLNLKFMLRESNYLLPEYKLIVPSSNIFFRCNCDDEYSCVLTDNLSDRQAYVFKCRTRAQSENMYLFPE